MKVRDKQTGKILTAELLIMNGKGTIKVQTNGDYYLISPMAERFYELEEASDEEKEALKLAGFEWLT